MGKKQFTLMRMSFQTQIIFLYLISFLPFIFMSFFNHPTTDDYWLGGYRLADGFFTPVYDYYYKWGGRLTMALIFCFEPLRWANLFWFKIIPIFLIIFLGLSFYYLIKTYFDSNLKNANVDLLLIGGLVTFLSSQPNIFEAIYWFPSVGTYTIGYILINLNLILFKKSVGSKSSFNIFILFYFINTLLLICTSELIAISWLFILFSIVYIFKFIMKTQIKVANYFASFSSLLIGFIILFTAPGLKNRFEVFPNSKNLLFSLLSGIELGFKYFTLGFNFNLLFFCGLIYYVSRDKLSSLNPTLIRKIFLLAIFQLAAVTFSVFFILAWSNGLKYLPSRVFNLTFYLQWPWLLTLTLIGFWKLDQLGFFRWTELSRTFSWRLFAGILVILVIGNRNTFNAIEDIITGRAASFHEVRSQNFLNLSKGNSEIGKIICLNELPDTFASTNHALNESDDNYKNYFKIKTIFCE